MCVRFWLYVYIFGALHILIICLLLIEFHLSWSDWQICWARKRTKPLKEMLLVFSIIYNFCVMNYLYCSPAKKRKIIYFVTITMGKNGNLLAHLEECCWLDKWFWNDKHAMASTEKYKIYVHNDRILGMLHSKCLHKV